MRLYAFNCPYWAVEVLCDNCAPSLSCSLASASPVSHVSLTLGYYFHNWNVIYCFKLLFNEFCVFLLICVCLLFKLLSLLVIIGKISFYFETTKCEWQWNALPGAILNCFWQLNIPVVGHVVKFEIIISFIITILSLKLD